MKEVTTMQPSCTEKHKTPLWDDNDTSADIYEAPKSKMERIN
jgi:hypothetical protein